MTRFSASQLIARVGSAIIEHFQGRGAVDFRLWPSAADKLRVCVHFSDRDDHRSELAALKSLIEPTGAKIEAEQAEPQRIGVEIAVRAPLPLAVVLPLRMPCVGRV
jgi:hypothetical protein